MDPFNAFNMSAGDYHRSSGSSAAASRQKSCNACVRGKRRCDKTYPRCTRCAAKGLDCVYQKVPPRPSHSSATAYAAAAASSTIATPTVPRQAQDINWDGSSTNSDQDATPDFDMEGLDFMDMGSSSSAAQTSNSTTPGTTASLNIDPTLDFSVVDILNDAANQGSSIWSLPPFAEPKADFPIIPLSIPTSLEQKRPIRELTLLSCDPGGSECLSIDPMVIHDPRSRFHYIINHITNLHLTFAQTRSLPFIHHRLYASSLPRTVMSAFCAATAYANRTPDTKAWVFKLLGEAANEVQKEGQKAKTAVEKVARVQALIVVESMRAFDGDFSSRVAAMKERNVLVEWFSELDRVKLEMEEDSTMGISFSKDQPPKSWDNWILIESMRRTSIAAAALLCLLYILESVTPPVEIWNQTQSFTAAKSLWKADSSFEFFRAWREEPQWCIKENKFEEFWQYAQPEDMDEFTRLMLTTQAGTDGVEHFLHGDTVPAPSASAR